MDLFGTKKARARRELWQLLARDLGGDWFASQGFWNPKHERIEVTLRGAPIVVDTYTVSSGNTQQSYTRVRAPYNQGPGPKVRVFKKGAFHMLGKWLGLTDHEVGDEAFDKLFVIKAESAAIAHRLWSEEARRLMFTWFRDAKVRSDHKGLELVDAGVWNDRERIKAGVDLVAELAARDLYGRDSLSRIDGVMSSDTDGWPRIELDTGVRVVLRAEVVGDRLRLVARTTERGGLDTGSIELVDGKIDPVRGAQLPPAAHVHLGKAGTGTLAIGDAGMSLAWRNVEIDAEQLRAGAELLGALATTATGAYR